MNTQAIMPTVMSLQSSLTLGICVLNDEETYTSSEGALWIGPPNNWSDEEDNLDTVPDALPIIQDPNVPVLHVDALPYLVIAGCDVLGIDTTDLTIEDIIEELDECVAQDEAEESLIRALLLALDYSH